MPDTDTPLRPIHTGSHRLRDLPGDSDRAAWLAGRIEDTRARLDALAGDLVHLEALAEVYAGDRHDDREILRAKDGTTPNRMFDRFVSEWPTSAADSPTRLRAAWDALTPADRQEAVESVPAYLARLEEAQRRHIPSGATYLAEKRWEALAVTPPPDRGQPDREDPATAPGPAAR